MATFGSPGSDREQTVASCLGMSGENLQQLQLLRVRGLADLI